MTNTLILELFANFIMSYVSFKYIETYTTTANIVVSSFFIFFNLSLFVYLRKKHIYRSSIFIDEFTSKLNSILILAGMFLIFCVKHFLLIRYSSLLDILSSSFTEINNPKVAVLTGIILALFIVECVLYFRQFANNPIENGVSLMVRRFNLDRKKTYFFGDIALSSFRVNEYFYFVALGLVINDRYYSSDVLLDYFNMVGINFNDLNENHIRNIEMYNI
jgi:hypothetical protein